MIPFSNNFVLRVFDHRTDRFSADIKLRLRSSDRKPCDSVALLASCAVRGVVRPERFELPTYCSGGNRSIQLSYGRVTSALHAGDEGSNWRTQAGINRHRDF